MSTDPDSAVDVDWSAALEQCTGKQDMLEMLLARFHDETMARLPDLEEDVHSGRDPEVKQVAHSIKSAAATLHCPKLRTAALDLEKGAKRNLEDPHSVQLHPLYEALVDALDSFTVFLSSRGVTK